MRSSIFAACAVLALADISSTLDDDWLSFPSKSGAVLIHKDCVHHFDDSDGSVDRGGDDLSNTPCPHAPRYQNAATDKLGESVDLFSYYSDWVGYTYTTGDFGYMSSEWVVPKAPKSHGPVPGMSSTYLFNGLEDGGGVHGKATYILQPVLSYGKSGCVIDPLNFFRWYLISFSVSGSGRAKCGKRIAVEEGERVKGILQMEADGHSWSTISIRLKNNDTSVASTDLADRQPDAAYNTLESMITYSCEAFPASGTVTFENNILKDRKGNLMKPSWKSLVRHTECDQQVKINSDDSVTINWDVTKDMTSRDSVVV